MERTRTGPYRYGKQVFGVCPFVPPLLAWLTHLVVRVRVCGAGTSHASVLAPKVGPLGLSPHKVSELIAKATADWRLYKIDVELHLRGYGPGGRWELVEVVPVPSTSLLVRRAFHNNNAGKWHAGQHGAPRQTLDPSRAPRRGNGCGEGGGSILFDELLEIAMLVRERELARHKQHMRGDEEPQGRRRKTAPCIAKDMRGTVKEVLGVVHSMHGLVEGEPAALWLARLDSDQALIAQVNQHD